MYAGSDASASHTSQTTHAGPVNQQGMLNDTGSGPSVSFHGYEVENEHAGLVVENCTLIESTPENVSKGVLQNTLDSQEESASFYSLPSFFLIL
jgi:hypothetical protein